MSDSMRDAMLAAQDATQRLAMGVVVLSALGSGGYSLAAALGQAPWLEMTAPFGDTTYPRAGMAIQLAATDDPVIADRAKDRGRHLQPISQIAAIGAVDSDTPEWPVGE